MKTYKDARWKMQNYADISHSPWSRWCSHSLREKVVHVWGERRSFTTDSDHSKARKRVDDANERINRQFWKSNQGWRLYILPGKVRLVEFLYHSAPSPTWIWSRIVEKECRWLLREQFNWSHQKEWEVAWRDDVLAGNEGSKGLVGLYDDRVKMGNTRVQVDLNDTNWLSGIRTYP